MNFKDIKYVHFIGIGGIGMSALARYFIHLKKSVSGYDRNQSDLTIKMEKEGMLIYYTENVALIPAPIYENPNSEEILIIYTPAIPNNHAELTYFRSKNVHLYKRSEILGEISKSYTTIGIAGTHGKTTTTSILTYICMTAKMPFASFVGGINENFKSNLVINGVPEFIITEADEYDRSFLKLRPKHGIITSMDADHLDIYESADDMSNTFKEFANLIDKDGLLLIEQKLKNKVSRKFKTYGLTTDSDFHPTNVNYASRRFDFDFIGPEIKFKKLKLSLSGYHNLENAISAIAMSIELGVDEISIREALLGYKGVKRRFEYQIDRTDFIYIDDYAHHPEEINAVISSVRKMYPGKKITGIFQPHLFSRTRDLAEDFARSLEKLDDLILLEIYPAREEPIPGITSSWLLNKVNIEHKSLCEKDDLLRKLQERKLDILITMGAGDIENMVLPIKNQYLK